MRNSGEAARLLAAGADPNARDILPTHRTTWETFLDSLPFLHRQPERTRKDPVMPTALMLAATGMRLDHRCSEYPMERIDYLEIFDSNPTGVCAVQDQPAMVRLLLDRGADVNASAEGGWTPLMLACKGGNLQIAALLLDRGATLNPPNGKNPSPISLAVGSSNAALVEFLLTRGADTGPSGTPLPNLLGDAISQDGFYEPMDPKQKAMLLLLLAHGASVNAVILPSQPNESAQTPLLYAVSVRKPAVAAMLIDKGADVNGVCADPEALQDTPLANAANGGDIPMAKLLLKRGADINGGKSKTFTPLMAALFWQDESVAKFLVASGADVNRGDGNGLTPLMVSRSMPAMTKLLLTHGAAVNAKTYSGTTALMMAAKGAEMADGSVISTAPAIRLLLAAGANPNARDWKGRTALAMTHDPVVRAALTSHP